VQQVKASSTSRGGFAWHLDASASAIAEARSAFEAWLREVGAVEDDVQDMAVVLSELASNAAAGAAPGSGADISAVLDRDELRLEVANRIDSRLDDITRWDLDDPLRGGGRGLLIVRAYTDSMEVLSADETVTVRCRRRLDLQ
jgi:anti-sigma regulatory factor (Ser/Thr protein kinase)